MENQESAALWSARLLPFSHILSGDPDIQDLVLSVLSELPCNAFLSDMLSHSFPTPSGESGTSNTKLKRILSRLRSMMDGPQQLSDPVPLSVKYQVRSQVVLAQRAEVFGNIGGMVSSSFLLNSDVVSFEKDLKVGDLSLEYDFEYFNFLKTLFSILVKPADTPSLTNLPPLGRGHGKEKYCLPYLSKFQCDPSRIDGSSLMITHSLYPLLDSLMRWSQMDCPRKAVTQRNTKSRLERKLSRRRSKLSSTMKVNLSLPVIVGCLMQREKSGLLWGGEHSFKHHPKVGGGEGIITTSGTSSLDDKDGGEQTKEKGSIIVREDNKMLFSSSGSMDCHAKRKSDVKLLNIPKGILQVERYCMCMLLE